VQEECNWNKSALNSPIVYIYRNIPGNRKREKSLLPRIAEAIAVIEIYCCWVMSRSLNSCQLCDQELWPNCATKTTNEKKNFFIRYWFPDDVNRSFSLFYMSVISLWVPFDVFVHLCHSMDGGYSDLKEFSSKSFLVLRQIFTALEKYFMVYLEWS
jgi:hypothetical protein